MSVISHTAQVHAVARWKPQERQMNVRFVSQSYKPPAIRLISLLIILAIFAGCVGLIEWTISDTASNGAAVPTATTPTLVRRELTTITTFDPKSITCLTQTAEFRTCANIDSIRSELQSVEDVWSKLCSVYSISFEPSKDRLPTSLQKSFTSWTNAYNSQQTTRRAMLGTLKTCTQDPLDACTSEWWLVLSPDLRKTSVLTIGCQLSTMTLIPPCTTYGSYVLQSGSITSVAIGVCGAKMVSQILITTDIPRSTSTSSAPREGNKVTITAASPTSILIQQKSTTSVVSTTSRLTTYAQSATVIQSVASSTQAGLTKMSSGSSSLLQSTFGSNTRNFYQPEITQSVTDSSSPRVGIIPGRTSNQVSVPDSPAPTRSIAAVAGDPDVDFTLSAHEIVVQRPFTLTTYFAAVFLPALIAVFLKASWSIVASSLRMIEPFQRLIESEHVTAKYSLLTQYLEGSISRDIIQSLIRGRMLPICSLLIYVMVEILPLVGAVSMSVRTRSKCVYQGEYRPCDPAWVIDLPVIRLVEALLFFCIALVIFLIWLTHRSHIPVAANPSSIVSLAALLNYEPLIVGLQKINPDADGKLFSAVLGKKVYCIAEHYDPKSKLTRFGFVSQPKESRAEVRTGVNMACAPLGHPNYAMDQQITARRSLFSPISRMWLRSTLHLLTTVGLLAVTVTYMLDTNLDDAFNRFFNGDSVPPAVSKTIFVGLAVIVDMQMKNLERTIRITDPFRRLALRNARAETTILLTLNGTCWSNLPRNLYLMFRYECSQGRMAWVTLVSFVACLSDANIVAVAGFLFNNAQTRESYYVCGYLSMACTSAILLTILITMAWWLRVPVIRRMPRQPDTIGNMLSYLCGSEIVKDWNSIDASSIPVENMSREERDALITRGGRRFCFGRMLGMDERERWLVDYEREQSQVMVVAKSW